jgi:hypothetical protein
MSVTGGRGLNNHCATGAQNFCPSLWSPLWPVRNQQSLLFKGLCDLWPKSRSKCYSMSVATTVSILQNHLGT